MYRALRHTAFFLLVLVLPGLCIHAQQPYPIAKRVLLIHHYSRDTPAIPLFDKGFEDSLKTAKPATLELYRETIESYRFPSESHAQLMRRYLKEKYADRKLDVIVAYTDTVLEFVTAYRDELFPGVPVVFVVSKRPEPARQIPLSTGVWVGPNIRDTVELALEVQPGTEHVTIISSPSNDNTMLEAETREQLTAFEGRLNITYLFAYPLEEVISSVQDLPPRSIVIFQRQTKGFGGRSVTSRDAVALISRASSVPVFATFDTMIGEGVVGGKMFSHEEIGKRTAQMALRILQGTKPEDMPIETTSFVPMFDWRELRRWNISESSLPRGSIVFFKQSSFWEQHKWRIIGVATLIILQSLLIAYLLFNRRQRRRAELERERFATLAKEEHRHLEQVISNVPGIVWQARYQPDGSFSQPFLSQQIVNLLGYSLAEWEANPKFWLTIVPEDERAETLRQVNSVFEVGKEDVVQFRWRARDGRLLWIESNLSVICDEKNAPIGLRGVSLDISDRKRTETALHDALKELGDLKEQLQQENLYLQEEIRREHNFEEIIGNSDELRYVLYKVEKVAPTDSVVLIQGETGTGKELIARAIHGTSKRKDRPLVKINCAALPATLIESELFGHEKGAFTGAQARKIGRFEVADGATLFLDEIGELPLELQPKLLRVLQEGEFERLGSSTTIKVDVRIIVATNRDLHTEVQRGLFREDLWYRLNVYPITIPPLRDRKNDIPLLSNAFIKKFSKKLGCLITSIEPKTLTALQGYHWPGNVRELRNTIERALINAQGSVLQLAESLEVPQEGSVAGNKTLEELEREIIIQRLEETNWRISGAKGAAESLGMHPNTLRARMSKLDIRKDTKSAAGRVVRFHR